MDDYDPLGLGAPLEAYTEIAYDYYMQDRLDMAVQVVNDAFASRGWPAGGWTEFYNELTCEKDARDASTIDRLDDLLSLELRRDIDDTNRGRVSAAAVEAREAVSEALDLEFSRPVLVTVFLPDAPLDFISGSHGYVAHKYDIDKICVPHAVIDPPENALDMLKHEFTHVATGELGGEEVPHWLDEGLAMVIGEDWSDRHSRFVLQTAVQRGRLLDVDRIEGMLVSRDMRKDDPQSVEEAYLLAASLVQWWERQSGIQTIREALVRIGDGEGAASAVKRSSGLSVRQMERGWRESLRSARNWDDTARMN